MYFFICNVFSNVITITLHYKQLNSSSLLLLRQIEIDLQLVIQEGTSMGELYMTL